MRSISGRDLEMAQALFQRITMTDNDQALLDKVSHALRRDPYLSRRELRFESQQGKVRLTGVVQSYYQKQMAQEVVRRVDGVAEIENELEVCWA